MAIRSEKPTLEEFLQWPEQKPYLELIHGEVRPKSVPDMRHGVLQGTLVSILTPWAHSNAGWAIPEQRCVLEAEGEEHTVLPDVAWWSSQQLPSVVSGPIRVPPTLAVEILSPDDRYGAVQDKVMVYLAAGVSIVWVFDPLTHNLTIYRPVRAPQVVKAPSVLRDDLLPGLEIDLAGLFARLPTPETPQPRVLE